MDEPVNPRIAKLLARLAARTDREGKPRPGYAENVAAIRAELAVLEKRYRGNS